MIARFMFFYKPGVTFYDCRRSNFHVVGKVLVEIIRIVVPEVKTLRGIALSFFGDTNHEDFTAEVFYFLVLFAKVGSVENCQQKIEAQLDMSTRVLEQMLLDQQTLAKKMLTCSGAIDP